MTEEEYFDLQALYHTAKSLKRRMELIISGTKNQMNTTKLLKLSEQFRTLKITDKLDNPHPAAYPRKSLAEQLTKYGIDLKTVDDGFPFRHSEPKLPDNIQELPDTF